MAKKIENSAETLAKRDHERVRRTSLWHKIRSWMGRSCNDLLPAEHVLGNLPSLEFQELGLQQVPLEKIVGSGRYRDFDLAFKPLRQENNGRWQSIAHARRQGISLPPPLLYQVGDAFIVEDGNHRVSVARSSGQEYIAANVIAIDTSSLEVEPSCTRLGYKISASQPQNGTTSCSS